MSIDTGVLEEWRHRFGPALGLALGPKALSPCWAQHPIARHELIGLFLAWTSLTAALAPAPPPDDDPYRPPVVPGPRDWLDLSNAAAPAAARAIAACTTCARAGQHITDPDLPRAP